jgi:ATP phosphoribosyltransferase regulatory subunit
MPALPQYDSALLAALDEQAVKMGRVFAASGYARVEPSIVQPADVFLDRSGEEIRRRTFVFDDGTGNEVCLRPDLTIPVCRMYLASGSDAAPAKFSYHGPAFRLQPNEPKRPSQFLQTGAENIGGEREAADIEVMTLAVEAVREAGLKDVSIKLGELGLFAALVDALDIPPQWRGRLKRHFWRPGYFKELLERLSQGAPAPAASYLANLGQAEPEQARAALNGLLDHLGAGRAATIGGRTREEIVDRLMEQAAEAAAVRLDKSQVTLIEGVLSVSGVARECIAKTRALIKGVGGATDAPLAQLETRIDALGRLGFKDDAIRFAARFGRNMEYYTGFVFELWSRDSEGPLQIAGGGRYDTLLSALGAARDIPSVGCAIRDERVLAARKAGGA